MDCKLYSSCFDKAIGKLGYCRSCLRMIIQARKRYEKELQIEKDKIIIEKMLGKKGK